MLNFLPQKNKNQIVFEYLLRISVYFLLSIFAASLILISLFFPSFFFVKFKNDTVNSQLELAKEKNINSGEDAAIVIKKVNQLATTLSSNGVSGIMYSDIVNKIISLKNKDIKILDIAINVENDTGDKKILVNGIASTRDGLTLFDKDIRTDGFFNSVTFPVSNFIKSTDSEFSATLIYREI